MRRTQMYIVLVWMILWTGVMLMGCSTSMSSTEVLGPSPVESLIQKASTGDAYSQGVLAEKYRKGDGVSKNIETALQFATLSAEQNHPLGLYNLAVLYDLGHGTVENADQVPQLAEQALQGMHRLAETGDTKAQHNLGVMYATGFGVEPDLGQAKEWYQKAATQGNQDSEFNLAVLLLSQEEDVRTALPLFINLAEKSYMPAQNTLGLMYTNGEGVAINIEEGIRWYKEAAERGNIEALNSLGLLYATGKGVEQNPLEAFKWYSQAAEQGSAEAQNNLGLLFVTNPLEKKEFFRELQKLAEEANGEAATKFGITALKERLKSGFADLEDVVSNGGKGEKQQEIQILQWFYEEAHRWFMKAAEQQYPDALFNLGILYKEGTGVEQDYQQAIQWFVKAAEQGSVKAQINLGLLYISGEGGEKNYEQALQWFFMAAEQQDPDAQYNLGLMFKEGTGVDQNDEQALQWFLQAAQQGQASAMYHLGLMFRDGIVVEQNHEEALQWFLQAAENNQIEAQFNLGLMYLTGTTVEKNMEMAFQWFLRAAEGGHAVAQNNIGFMYEGGMGVQQNLQEAFQWYQRAAEQENTNAQFSLGFLYEAGRGTEQNFQEALKWYLRAARHGDAQSQNNLGRMYETGLGGRTDYREAAKWYLAAAKQDHITAQVALAQLYENGNGVKQDYELAIQWYQRAVGKGYPIPAKNLEELRQAHQEREQAFENARRINTVQAYKAFVDKYPGTTQTEEALLIQEFFSIGPEKMTIQDLIRYKKADQIDDLVLAAKIRASDRVYRNFSVPRDVKILQSVGLGAPVIAAMIETTAKQKGLQRGACRIGQIVRFKKTFVLTGSTGINYLDMLNTVLQDSLFEEWFEITYIGVVDGFTREGQVKVKVIVDNAVVTKGRFFSGENKRKQKNEIDQAVGSVRILDEEVCSSDDFVLKSDYQAEAFRFDL